MGTPAPKNPPLPAPWGPPRSPLPISQHSLGAGGVLIHSACFDAHSDGHRAAQLLLQALPGPGPPRTPPLAAFAPGGGGGAGGGRGGARGGSAFADGRQTPLLQDACGDANGTRGTRCAAVPPALRPGVPRTFVGVREGQQGGQPGGPLTPRHRLHAQRFRASVPVALAGRCHKLPRPIRPRRGHRAVTCRRWGGGH